MSNKFAKSFFTSSLHNHADKMLVELDLVKKLANQHSGEKGRETEGILSGFLKSAIPRKWSVDTGFIMDLDNVSKQTDIIIHNDLEIPPLYSGYSNKIIPINSLGCAIEVKMNLTNEKKTGSLNIEKCHENANIIKNMHKKLIEELKVQKVIKSDEETGEPLYIVFCYQTGYSLESITNKLKDIRIHKNEVAIDLFVVLNKGFVFLKSDKSDYVSYHANMLSEVGQKTNIGYEIKKEHMLIIEFFAYLMEGLRNIKLFQPDYVSWKDTSLIEILK